LMFVCESLSWTQSLFGAQHESQNVASVLVVVHCVVVVLV
jgi:hypothetical protein